ncbi:MAG: ribosomal protein S18-alanine N-acetyltransferase [Methylophilaceae bacterium]|jgi:ribosomal-protein-alanine N-acetyltransferase|nr:ribosomal protein S18-alanine N-acetyltransferase [Methylophilaceae bacterium]
MQITESDAIESDLKNILLIESQNKVALWSLKNFQESLTAKDYFKVVRFNDETVAFIIAKVMNHECEILNLGVEISMRKKKLASKLLNNLIDFSKARNIKQIFLEVRVSNTAAVNLYDKFKFNEIGCRPNYYITENGREDALIMGVDL